MATVIDRDRKLAALLGHSPADTTWEHTLVTIAYFRENTHRMAHADLKEELEKAREELTRSLPGGVYTSAKVAAQPKDVQGIAWALFVAVHRFVKSNSIEHAMSDADTLLAGYTKRFGKELNHDQTHP
jgi:hypothetical protein